MGERIEKPSLIHKKCKKQEIIEYGGGDKSYYCNYCQEWIFDPKEEILTEDEYFKNFHLWRGGLDKEEKK